MARVSRNEIGRATAVFRRSYHCTPVKKMNANPIHTPPFVGHILPTHCDHAISAPAPTATNAAGAETRQDGLEWTLPRSASTAAMRRNRTLQILGNAQRQA